MHRLTVSRRTVLGGATLLTTPSVIRSACAAGRVVVGTWGGDYARLLRENVDDPILKPQGIEVVQDVGDEAPRFAKLTAQRMLPRGNIDIACLGAPNGYRAGQAGLLAKLDPANAPNLKTITGFLWNDYFVPHIYSAQVIAYNPQTVSDPPKSFGDLLDPKWKGKIVKAHPGYSGTIITVTFEISRDIGWDFFAKLGWQQIMQVQSAAEPPKKVAEGERPVAADGGEYLPLQMIGRGAPLALVYPPEGTPSIPGGAGVVVDAPHPNAARLFAIYLFSRAGQQLMVDMARIRSVHPDVKLPDGMKPLAEIKVMKPDAAAQEKETATIKEKYAEYFGL